MYLPYRAPDIKITAVLPREANACLHQVNGSLALQAFNIMKENLLKAIGLAWDPPAKVHIRFGRVDAIKI
jgi:hypothetical protein